MLVALSLALACSLPSAAPAPTHTVTKGETVGEIAARYAVTVDDIVRWNQLPSADRIEVGQVLYIWPGGHQPPGDPPGKRARRDGRTQGPGEPPAAATPLALPREQPCLPLPELTDDDAMVATAGLTEAQISAALSSFVGNTLRCVPPGRPADGTLRLRITAACTGRVAGIEVLDLGGLPPELARCATEVLRYTPLPAHDQRDGFSFEYPLRFATTDREDP